MLYSPDKHKYDRTESDILSEALLQSAVTAEKENTSTRSLTVNIYALCTILPVYSYYTLEAEAERYKLNSKFTIYELKTSEDTGKTRSAPSRLQPHHLP